MKTSTIPSLRVEPELRAAAESVLEEGETLSSFVEQSVRANIQRRQSQQEFIARGLAAREEAKRTGEYFEAERCEVSFRVRYTRAARDDLQRLYGYQLQRDRALARRARDTIAKAIEVLKDFPFSCRKASPDNPFLREMLIPFGSAGYVVLFEVEDSNTVTILALRHQREDDYS
jgi:plasmid stabilization system protein ParE